MKTLRRSPGALRLVLSLGLLGLVGCSSMSTPVLRHETGDTLGAGKGKVDVSIETGRMYPIVPTNSLAVGIPQATSAFQGSLFGIQGTYGLGTRLDIQLRTYYAFGGAGWRLGAKYKAWTHGPFSVGAMMGFGRYAGSGSIGLADTTGAVDASQSLSGWQFDLGVPVSVNLTKESAIFSGLTLWRSGVKGRVNDGTVSAITYDLALNLGYKLTISRFEIGSEFAFVRMYDPFADGMKFTPYWGLFGGILF